MKLLYHMYKDFLLDAATEDTVLEQWDDIQCGYDEPSCVAPCVLSCVRAGAAQTGRRAARARSARRGQLRHPVREERCGVKATLY